jgi:cell filamentation protein
MAAKPKHHSSDVPENKFGLSEQVELQRRETPFALRRLLELQLRPIAGDFDTRHLQAIHRYIFQDVYGWAGELRTVGIAKPGAAFPPPAFLKVNLDSLFVELAHENSLKNLSAAAWVHRAAYFLGEINAIHPFREGNGRTQREFIRELALAGGYRLIWAKHTQQEMIEASQRSFLRKDYSALEGILCAAPGIDK